MRIIIAFLVFLSTPIAALAGWLGVEADSYDGGVVYIYKVDGGCEVLAPLHVLQARSAWWISAPGIDRNTRKIFIRTKPFENAIRDDHSLDLAFAEIESMAIDCDEDSLIEHPQGALTDLLTRAERSSRVTAFLQYYSSKRYDPVGIDITEVFENIIKFRLKSDPPHIVGQGLSGSPILINDTVVAVVSNYDTTQTPFIYEATRLDALRFPRRLKTKESTDGWRSIPAIYKPGLRSSMSQDAGVRDSATPSSESSPPFLTECDRIAANSSDLERNKNTQGRSYDEMTNLSVDYEDVIPICRDAIGKYPDSARLQYQYARLLYFRFEKTGVGYYVALQAMERALAMGHQHAIVNIRELLEHEKAPCGMPAVCGKAFIEQIEVLRKFEPNLARLTLATAFADSDFYISTCLDRRGCDEAAREELLQVRGPLYGIAQANLAYLYRLQRLPSDCYAKDECASFAAGTYAKAISESELWIERELANLLAEQRTATELCFEEAECVQKAMAHWQKISSRDSRSAYNLAYYYSGPNRWRFTDCADEGSVACVQKALSYLDQVDPNDNEDAALLRAHIYLYQWDDGVCQSKRDCVERAKPLLLREGFADSNWGKSILAEALFVFPELFPETCANTEDCERRSVVLNREAAEDDVSYNMIEVAWQYMLWPRISDCPEAECFDRGVTWLKKAMKEREARALYVWGEALFRTYKGSPACDQDDEETAACLARVKDWLQTAMSTQTWASDTLDKYKVAFLGPENSVRFCVDKGEACSQALEAAAGRLASSAMSSELLDIVNSGWLNSCRTTLDCHGRQQDLLRVAARFGGKLDGWTQRQLFSAMLWLDKDERDICGGKLMRCGPRGPTSVAHLIASVPSTDTIDMALYDVSENFLDDDENFKESATLFRQYVEIVAARGGLRSQFLVADSLVWRGGQSNVDRLSGADVNRVFETFMHVFESDSVEDIHSKAALELFYLTNDGDVFDASNLPGRVLYTLLLIDGDDHQKWLQERVTEGRIDPEAIKAMQRLLGVEADGKVGPKTWAEISRRNLAYEKCLYGDDTTDGTETASASTQAQACDQNALLEQVREMRAEKELVIGLK